MATSGSADFTLNARQIIVGAREHLGILETPPADAFARDLLALNLMIKSLGTKIRVWTSESATLFLEAGTESYDLTDADTHCVSSFVETTTADDSTAGDADIDVTSIVGISASDVIGIRYSATAFQWTTVNGAPGGSTVTLTDVLTNDVDSGAAIFTFTPTAIIGKPLNIVNVQRKNQTVDTPIWLISEEEYFDQPSKTSQGTITQVYYDRRLTTGILYVWPTSTTVIDMLRFRYQRVVEDFDAATNNPDFPQEWLETLTYNLAVRRAPSYGVAPRPDVVLMAAELLNALESFDTEDTSTFFQPEYRS